MARSFSEDEKAAIRAKLLTECEKSWAAVGYKKTKIDELCAKAGISKGAFYLFYDSKEELFCQLFDLFQERFKAVEEMLPEKPTKADISRMLKQLYLEYDRTKLLPQRNDPDFQSFLNRAPKEWIAKSQQVSDDFISAHIFDANLKLKMSREKATGLLEALLAIVITKELLHYDHYEVFCTLLDSILDDIYE